MPALTRLPDPIPSNVPTTSIIVIIAIHQGAASVYLEHKVCLMIMVGINGNLYEICFWPLISAGKTSHNVLWLAIKGHNTDVKRFVVIGKLHCHRLGGSLSRIGPPLSKSCKDRGLLPDLISSKWPSILGGVE